jgi:transposase
MKAIVQDRYGGPEVLELVMAVAPALLAEPGIGPISAAQLLISWSHPGRFRSAAAVAMLAGAAPVQASSGQVVRHRRNLPPQVARTGGPPRTRAGRYINRAQRTARRGRSTPRGAL